jgi:hypothetical protein
MKKSICVLILAGLLSGCLTSDLVRETGTVVYNQLEGGFYGIQSDEGARYEPLNLPPEYRIDGLKVMFRGVIRPDMATIHMWGKPLELLHIEKSD